MFGWWFTEDSFWGEDDHPKLLCFSGLSSFSLVIWASAALVIHLRSWEAMTKRRQPQLWWSWMTHSPNRWLLDVKSLVRIPFVVSYFFQHTTTLRPYCSLFNWLKLCVNGSHLLSPLEGDMKDREKVADNGGLGVGAVSSVQFIFCYQGNPREFLFVYQWVRCFYVDSSFCYMVHRIPMVTHVLSFFTCSVARVVVFLPWMRRGTVRDMRDPLVHVVDLRVFSDSRCTFNTGYRLFQKNGVRTLFTSAIFYPFFEVWGSSLSPFRSFFLGTSGELCPVCS